MAQGDRADWRWDRSRKRRGSLSPAWPQPAAGAAAQPAHDWGRSLSFLRVRSRRGIALCGLVEQELADQVLEHHGRLGSGNGIPCRQVLVVGAGLDAEVLLAQEAAGENLHRAVLGKREA